MDVLLYQPNLGGLLTLALTVALPIVVGLVTKSSTSPGVKATLLLFLSAVSVFIETWLNTINAGGTFEFIPVLYNLAITFVVAVAAHFGLWRPVGVSQAAQSSLVKD